MYKRDKDVSDLYRELEEKDRLISQFGRLWLGLGREIAWRILTTSARRWVVKITGVAVTSATSGCQLT